MYVCVGHRPGILEVMHNLDYCDVLVIGEELNPEHESLEIHQSSLLGKHLDATNSTSGISIYGMTHASNSAVCTIHIYFKCLCILYGTIFKQTLLFHIDFKVCSE